LVTAAADISDPPIPPFAVHIPVEAPGEVQAQDDKDS